ncbi:hypothetical protein [Prevotella pallens]|uniref:hypothetical protein n=1 Tax=Prevotella pallens TaxID=60133 RepID=UPI0028ED0CCE|nr:hypothetical protein [Prevotella pallens]
MSGYGHDESAPTPNGLFATHFVGVCGYFTDCSPRIHGVFRGYFRVFVGCLWIVRHAFTVRIWYIGVVCKAKTSKGTMRNALFSQHLRG